MLNVSSPSIRVVMHGSQGNDTKLSQRPGAVSATQLSAARSNTRPSAQSIQNLTMVSGLVRNRQFLLLSIKVNAIITLLLNILLLIILGISGIKTRNLCYGTCVS